MDSAKVGVVMEMYMNHLPAETWNRLGVNGVKLARVPEGSAGAIDNSDIKGWKRSTSKVKANEKLMFRDTEGARKICRKGGLLTGVGPDTDKLLNSYGAVTHVFKADKKGAEPLILDFDYGDNGNDATSIEVVVGDGVDVVVVEQFTSAASEWRTICVQTKFVLGKGAKVTFVQVQDLNDKVKFINDIGVLQNEDSAFAGITAIIKGGKTYYGAMSNLYGNKSKFNMNIGYSAVNKEKLDMNLVAMHFGKKTEASIKADGVLRGEAEKIFRSTVDFNAGCSGSIGEERENVLLMDDTVVNKTVPLILCDEEDVSGAHGGSIGRLDDETLFYMMSRGMSKEAVYETVAASRIDAVINMIPVPTVKERWIKRLHPEEE